MKYAPRVEPNVIEIEPDEIEIEPAETEIGLEPVEPAEIEPVELEPAVIETAATAPDEIELDRASLVRNS